MALVGVLMIALAWLLADAVLRMALSRNREFLADAGAVELTADPDAMISALRKVEGNADMPRGLAARCARCSSTMRRTARCRR